MDTRVATLRQRAGTLLQRRELREAATAYRHLLALAPDEPDDWYNLGYVLRALGDYEPALQAYAQALARGVQDPEEVHLNRSVILTDLLRRDDEAERELRAALACRPGYAPALLNLGNLYEEHGRRDEAAACYRALVSPPVGHSLLQRCDARDPQLDRRCEALARLVQLEPPRSVDAPMLDALRRPLPPGAEVAASTRANMRFALGRVLDQLQAYDAAFQAFAEANAWSRRGAAPHDRRRSVAQVDALMAVPLAPAGQVNADGAGGSGGAGECGPGASPLFICGMFRSGSTLLEQVLAAHPDVTAGGELELLPRWATTRLAPLPATLATMTDAQAQALAAEYRAHLAQRFPQASAGRYVTDKRPDNYLYIGLIKRLFPTARIVHTTRHPLDNAVSIYAQHLNPQGFSYAADLADIGHQYGQYRRLMAHWRQHFADSVVDFDYDAFVRAPEPALRQLLAFLGLPWHEGCLSFQLARNPVKTASYWQVRRPLYRDASGRWKHYAAHLGPLRQALAEGGVDLSDDSAPHDGGRSAGT